MTAFVSASRLVPSRRDALLDGIEGVAKSVDVDLDLVAFADLHRSDGEPPPPPQFVELDDAAAVAAGAGSSAGAAATTNSHPSSSDSSATTTASSTSSTAGDESDSSVGRFSRLALGVLTASRVARSAVNSAKSSASRLTSSNSSAPESPVYGVDLTTLVESAKADKSDATQHELAERFSLVFLLIFFFF